MDLNTQKVIIGKLILLMTLSTSSYIQASPEIGQRLSFVSCPVVRDTTTVPCWTSDYEGDTYYLTIQSDVSAKVQPPLLGHQVLVEGVVSDKPAICGGIVLEEIHLTSMPELDANCNTILPVDKNIIIDFNPRPPGPSSGRLAFQSDPAVDPTLDPTETLQSMSTESPQVFNIYFDFDKGITFRHPGVLIGILEAAESLQPTTVKVVGMRGSHKLSNGNILLESENTAQLRAEGISRLLRDAGILANFELSWVDTTDQADGVNDWQSRQVKITLER